MPLDLRTLATYLISERNARLCDAVPKPLVLPFGKTLG